MGIARKSVINSKNIAKNDVEDIDDLVEKFNISNESHKNLSKNIEGSLKYLEEISQKLDEVVMQFKHE